MWALVTSLTRHRDGLAVHAGQRAPKALYLGVANSGRARRRAGRALTCCRVTLYAPFWLASSASTVLKVWDRPADAQRAGLPEVLQHSAMLAPRGVYGAAPLPVAPLLDSRPSV